MAATAVRRPPAITDLATTTSRDHRHCRCSKLDWNVRQHLHGVCCTVGAKMLAPVIRASTARLCSHKYAFVGSLTRAISAYENMGLGLTAVRSSVHHGTCALSSTVCTFAELMPQWRTTPSNASTATAYGANVLVAYKHGPSFL